MVYKPHDNYRYITNKNHSEIGVIFTNLANGTTLWMEPLANWRWEGIFVGEPWHVMALFVNDTLW